MGGRSIESQYQPFTDRRSPISSEMNLAALYIRAEHPVPEPASVPLRAFGLLGLVGCGELRRLRGERDTTRLPRKKEADDEPWAGSTCSIFLSQAARQNQAEKLLTGQ